MKFTGCVLLAALVGCASAQIECNETQVESFTSCYTNGTTDGECTATSDDCRWCVLSGFKTGCFVSQDCFITDSTLVNATVTFFDDKCPTLVSSSMQSAVAPGVLLVAALAAASASV
jgi:hypothetical protein